MKPVAIAAIITGLVFLIGVKVYTIQSFSQYVAGRMYIRERGISAEVYTREAEPIDGMSSLWHGGKVTVKADLSAVQLGDTAEIYTVEGEHLVLECIEIRKGLTWRVKPQGDVLIINGHWMYRFTRL